MSGDASDPLPVFPQGQRGQAYSSRPAAARGSGLLGCLFTVSVILNIVAFGILLIGCMIFPLASGSGEINTTSGVHEKFFSGNKEASDKIAIVHLNGIIMEGSLEFVHKEIEKAAQDKSVKAVVLRINSPGGSITASDDLYRRFEKLRDGDTAKKTFAKPLVVSMASVAASGGYYVAMPAKAIFAERTTMTGSIGVYASFPNIAGLSEKWQVKMELFKQGEIKDSGSPFKEMTAKERQVWQDLVDTAYNQFVGVVETGRPSLKGKLLEAITIKPVQAGPVVKEKPADYKRYRADGGVFTADKALEFGLIDKIGTVEDAIQEAKNLAALGEDYKVIDYEKPKTLFSLLGIEAKQKGLPDLGQLQNGLITRLWFVAPGSELAGMLAAFERE